MNPQHSSLWLPPELKRILQEVAMTGKCASLPWTAAAASSSDHHPLHSNSNSRNGNSNSNSNSHKAKKRRNRSRWNSKEDRWNHYHTAEAPAAQQAPPAAAAGVTESPFIHRGPNKTPYWESQQEQEQQQDKDEKEQQDDDDRVQEDGLGEEELETNQNSDLIHGLDNGSSGGGGNKDIPSTAAAAEQKQTLLLHPRKRKRKQCGGNFDHHGDGVTNPPQSYHTSSCSESGVSSVGGGSSTLSIPSSSASMGPLSVSLPFRTLRGAMRLAVALVLEYSYKTRGGYKLSPVEKRRFQMYAQKEVEEDEVEVDIQQQQQQQIQGMEQGEESMNGIRGDGSLLHGRSIRRGSSISRNRSRSRSDELPSFMDIAFMERRLKLLKLLGGGKSSASATAMATKYSSSNACNSYSSMTRVMSGSASVSDGGCTSDASFESDRRRTMLGAGDDLGRGGSVGVGVNGRMNSSGAGPPFTIQRVAEVLLMPERYYGQTHKLCNALEKLLLVTSPCTAYGGIMGGAGDAAPYTFHPREELEHAGHPNRRWKKWQISSPSPSSSSTPPLPLTSSSPSSLTTSMDGRGCVDPIIRMNVDVLEGPCLEMNQGLLASNHAMTAERMSATTTSQISCSEAGNAMVHAHHHHHHHEEQDKRSDRLYPHTRLQEAAMVIENNPNTEKTTSGVSSTLSMSPIVQRNIESSMVSSASSPSTASPHITSTNIIHRSSSPSLYSSQNLNFLTRNNYRQMRVSQGQQRKVIAEENNSLGSQQQNVQMEIFIDPSKSDGHKIRPSSANSVQNNLAAAAEVAYLESVDSTGRSSASNSDVDSESDDISFDEDSASDRSDGSLSDFFDPAGNISNLTAEPFTAARVMALNRMQQQHRREQYLQDRALRQVSTIFQPPPDSEYQSGDSVDSALAEDSCGSDSSSSDFTDETEKI